MSIYWRKMKIRNKKRATITSVLNAVATDYGLSKLNSLFIQRSNYYIRICIFVNTVQKNGK